MSPPQTSSGSALASVLRGVLLLAAVAGLSVAAIVPRVRRREALAETAAAHNGPRRVVIGRASLSPRRVELSLPATVRPWRSAMMRANATGFVRRTLVEIGASVHTGELLAEVSAPETQEQIRSARARLNDAEEGLAILQNNARRYAALADAGQVAPQQAEQTHAEAISAQASVQSSRGEIRRLGVIQGYQRVVAPFDGTITQRFVDPGALVSPSGAALYEVMDLTRLRVTVDVPQRLAPEVHVGTSARIFLADAARPAAEATVTRTAGAIDPSTRALRVEIDVPSGGALLPGAFVTVKLAVTRERPTVLVPASALMVGRDGVSVLRVRAGDTLERVSFTLGRDLGRELEALSGVSVGDRLVLNPGDAWTAGEHVLVVERPTEAPH